MRLRRVGSASLRSEGWETDQALLEALAIDGEGPLILDELNLMLAAARAGFGLAYLSEWNVAADLAAGSLVRVLDEWTPPFPGLSLYYPGRQRMARHRS